MTPVLRRESQEEWANRVDPGMLPDLGMQLTLGSLASKIPSLVQALGDQLPSAMRSVSSLNESLGETGAIRNPFGAPSGYHDLNYPTSLPVKAYTEPGVPFYDEIKGLNPGHALYNAKQNWPGMDVQPTGLSGASADRAQKIMDGISQLYKELGSLKGSR